MAIPSWEDAAREEIRHFQGLALIDIKYIDSTNDHNSLAANIF